MKHNFYEYIYSSLHKITIELCCTSFLRFIIFFIGIYLETGKGLNKSSTSIIRSKLPMTMRFMLLASPSARPSINNEICKGVQWQRHCLLLSFIFFPFSSPSKSIVHLFQEYLSPTRLKAEDTALARSRQPHSTNIAPIFQGYRAYAPRVLQFGEGYHADNLRAGGTASLLNLNEVEGHLVCIDASVRWI